MDESQAQRPPAAPAPQLNIFLLLKDVLIKPVAAFNAVATAAAIRVYKFKNGQSPPDLSALVPEYLTGLPPDVFRNGILTYIPWKSGTWTLYSVGPDKKDTGRAVECRDPQWDGKTDLSGDLVFRSVASEKKAPGTPATGRKGSRKKRTL